MADAREKRDAARKLLANGVDPGVLKQTSKIALKASAENSFEFLAREWHAKNVPNWTASHSKKVLRRLERDIFPWLGQRLIIEIASPELLKVLRRVESRGALDTAHRLHQDCGQIFRYGIATGRAERDPSADLRGALAPARKKHYPTITDPEAISNLLLDINNYEGRFVTKCALRLAPLLFVRPGELRKAEWSEFDFAMALWRIPPSKMKKRAHHLVPLSMQAIAILLELKALTGDGIYLFPSVRSLQRSMSDNTVNAALRRLGYTKDEFTGHSFRSMASTILNEQGWNGDVIERQLAHAERNSTRAAYNHAEYLSERRKMMQHWADYLDSLLNNNAQFSKAA